VEISTSPMVDKECDAVAGVVTVLRRVEPVPVPAPPCDTAAV
jgi:hypothetical protein